MQEKKEWETPRLLIIARSAPEESVLFACGTTVADCGDPNDETGSVIINLMTS